MAQSPNVNAHAAAHEKITKNPKFQELVGKRRAFAWLLSTLMLGIYAGFIPLIAYGKAFWALAVGRRHHHRLPHWRRRHRPPSC